MNGKLVIEFIALKPKMYSYKVVDSEFKKAKGVPKQALQRSLNFVNYRKTVEENENKKINQFNSVV